MTDAHARSAGAEAEHRTPLATAISSATQRATHQLLDGEPKILLDAVVVGLIDETRPERILAQQEVYNSRTRQFGRGLFVLRNRFAEDELSRSAAAGVRQYVILGAGLDTFAYRQPAFARDLVIFEVDHPATQAWKRERLACAGLAEPSNLRWAPVDFERDVLLDGLQQAGFDRTRPAFFSWLGVTQYLTVPAIDATLRVVASLPPPSAITFTYVLPDKLLSDLDLETAQTNARRGTAAGEPWLTRLHPEEVTAHLHELGFGAVVQLTPEEATARYFANRADGLRCAAYGRLVTATVSEPGST